MSAAGRSPSRQQQQRRLSRDPQYGAGSDAESIGQRSFPDDDDHNALRGRGGYDDGGSVISDASFQSNGGRSRRSRRNNRQSSRNQPQPQPQRSRQQRRRQRPLTPSDDDDDFLGPVTDNPLDTVGNTVNNTANQLTDTATDVAANAQQQKPKKEEDNTLKLRLDLNLDVEIQLNARVHGDVTLAMLG
ncbi:hypothetical protein BDB00DRAFT_783513 [Zychaea mexicana]|uniref:uncharacterized protein n=1 Tax=Zychaea mexicana TaxID=64656 RepID=UPI0022FE5FB9|nr:uncharacterized protein BDB00DRAFT_783513 [Zychaea mexicana]KAI9498891.1 hypothetical protein BDB00DRAFT_783513 [Zychaea mexicana]